jgi:hypothetical protein
MLTPRPADPRRRLPVIALAGAALAGGLAGPSVLLGLPLPDPAPRLLGSHGVLMALGFLGTLIALERAAALGRPWGWVAPLASGAGGVSVLLGLPGVLGAVLFLVAGAALVAIYAAFDRVERSLHGSVQAIGAIGWLVGATLLLVGRPIGDVVPWLGGFVVLTIAGERLELARIGRPAGPERPLLLVALGVLCAGIALTLVASDAGMRLTGAGLLALAAWFATWDLARRTVRRTGITRYIAVCLWAGYAWLAVAGAWWLAAGAAGGAERDAATHALFLGFAISMVFGHAPIILPAVLGVPLPYHPAFYVHLAVLHAGLLVRVGGGDLAGSEEAWRIGSLLNVAAMVLFVAASATAAVIALARRPRGDQPPTEAGTV